ncbi:uncharacterized protein LOC142985760 [Anticarsia gemmatalis]|uniref:uncharacterized protein LOC142985760 n=1 Tax=Anticarsia gemmatalis TaxID=129554 RepID=UPI003F76F065
MHAHHFPRALEAITQGHYMDDLVVSYDTSEEAWKTIEETRIVHAAAGFTLRGWSSNDPTVLRDVPSELHATTNTQLGGERPENKILGLYWNAERDELGFNTSMNRVPAEVRAQTRAPTKREALSAKRVSYLLLGCHTWTLSVNYAYRDATILELMNTSNYMCCVTPANKPTPLWRTGVYSNDRSISVSLVAAKAKVAPRRAQTIPRLELQCAAVIGAKLADTIKKEHRVEVSKTMFWTDSTTVVHWIRNDERRYTPFVAHRLGEISELTHKNEWRWLSTDKNVADDATRLQEDVISADDRWFQGPEFLHMPEDQWPTEQPFEVETEEVLHTIQECKQDSWLTDPTCFSKYEVLVRATARVLAFIDIKIRRIALRLEIKHIERAESLLIQHAQQESFGEEIKRLRAGRPIPRTSRLFRLDPVFENDTLRVRGRIDQATAPEETKHPVILDGRHPLTKLIVLREHCAAGHANRERVTNDLRQKYWIIQLRPTVRAVESNCALCRVRRSRPQPPATGDLPKARLDPFHRPFTNCGVDYFGPMNVKIGRRREKRWGALFTCLTTRAVHIELVASLSTDSAIMALRRMAARRGWPRLMYSDNATNFRGADQEL